MSQLNPEILIKIQKCFQDLQPQVKLKLLLSLFHIPKRNLETWRKELEDILDVAKEDSGVYVCKGINGFGSEEVQIELIVIGKLSIEN